MKHVGKMPFVALLAAGGMCAAWIGAFESMAVCRHCGAYRESVEWQIPGTQRTVFQKHRVIENDFSAFAAKHGRTNEASHSWVFAGGNGNGLMASGPGVFLLPTTQRGEIRGFLELCFEHDGRLGAKMLDAALDFRRVDKVFLLALYSHEYHPTMEGFERWRSEHADEIAAVVTPEEDGRD